MSLDAHSQNGKYFALLFSLVGIFIFAPFFEQPDGTNIVSNLALIAVLVLSIWVISHNRTKLLMAIAIATPLFVTNIFSIKFASEYGFILALQVCALLFFVYVTALIFKEVLTSKNVDAGIIVGSICVYMLLGLCWAFAYGIIELLYPQSFSHTTTVLNVGSFVYFSLVTLTTLGFGDITPISSVARSFVTMQAIAGQVYLTVLVAKLVGTYISRSGT